MANVHTAIKSAVHEPRLVEVEGINVTLLAVFRNKLNTDNNDVRRRYAGSYVTRQNTSIDAGCYVCIVDLRQKMYSNMAQLEARGAHNPEVTRSKRVVAI